MQCGTAVHDQVTSSAVCFGSEEVDLLTEQLEVYIINLGMRVTQYTATAYNMYMQGPIARRVCPVLPCI